MYGVASLNSGFGFGQSEDSSCCQFCHLHYSLSILFNSDNCCGSIEFPVAMISLLSVAVLLAVGALVYTWRNWYCQPAPQKVLPEIGLDNLKALNVDHELRAEFLKLVRDDGAGSWPPVARHHNWPAALSAYSKVYAEVAPHLATPEPSLDDDFNLKRCAEFRTRMRASLEQHVDVDAVAKCLQPVLDDDWSELSRDSFNGFYSCIACLRHAYRYVSQQDAILTSCCPANRYSIATHTGGQPIRSFEWPRTKSGWHSRPN
jgi:hypothetical protein